MRKNKVIAIVVGEFHESESEAMVNEASKEIEANGHVVGSVIWVPGSYEVPIALKRLLMDEAVDGAVVLGIIERGETSHGSVMANVVSQLIVGLSLEFMKPVGMGVLGPDIFPSQIEPRVRPYAQKAAAAAIRML